MRERKCPYCGSRDFESVERYIDVKIGTDKCVFSFHCFKCGQPWHENFIFKEVEETARRIEMICIDCKTRFSGPSFRKRCLSCWKKKDNEYMKKYMRKKRECKK